MSCWPASGAGEAELRTRKKTIALDGSAMSASAELGNHLLNRTLSRIAIGEPTVTDRSILTEIKLAPTWGRQGQQQKYKRCPGDQSARIIPMQQRRRLQCILKKLVINDLSPSGFVQIPTRLLVTSQSITTTFYSAYPRRISNFLQVCGAPTVK
jgi:hypothetical protein